VTVTDPVHPASITPRRPTAGPPLVFATSADEPRARRVTDVVLLAASLLGLLVASLWERPIPGFVRALVGLLAAVPSFLDVVWQLLADLLVVLALALVVLAAARRRLALLRDVLVAVVVALLVSALVGRMVGDEWPDLWNQLLRAEPPAWYPAVRIAVPAAVVVTAAPHLTRPVRRLGRWLMALAAFGAVVLGATTPLGAVAAILVGAAAAAAVHLAFGSSAGRPSLTLVGRALEELGVPTRSLGAADRQDAGSFLVEGEDTDGQPLLVKVFGRDAHDVALWTTLWRTVWYRQAGAPLRLGRLQQVEHEAFLTLLARQAGVATDTVVIAGATADDDALLVLRRTGTALGAPGAAPVAADELRAIWETVERIHAAGIGHGQIDASRVVRVGDRIGLVDFSGGVAAPTEVQRRTDQVQALLTSVLVAGPDQALAVAREALGEQRLTALLPYIQPAVLTSAQRAEVAEVGLDLDEVRSRAADVLAVEAPKLLQLRRITVGTVLRLALPAVALIIVISAAGNFDWSELPDRLADASGWLLALGFLAAQTPRVSQAVSTLGASPIPLPLGPVYALQLATSYINLAVPSTAARVALNIRFFQRHGVPPGTAMAAGALDGFSGFLTQAGLLLGILLLTSASLELDLSNAGATAGSVLALVLVLVAAVVTAVLLVPPWRRFVLGWATRIGREALVALRGLRSPRRLVLLFGGNLATEVLFATSLGIFCQALGAPLGLGELLVVNISVALLAGLLPVPGGIGVAEGGLTFGLVRAGVPEEIAFTAVLLQRAATFYLPPLWGWFAMRWLQRRNHL
jgi:glycosyltransferase 2 family protein